MKFQLLLALALAAPVLSTQLPQNAACGDSYECAHRCKGGRYHIVSNQDSGDIYFGCALQGENNYSAVLCSVVSGSGVNKDTTTHQVCEAAGGRPCTTNKFGPPQELCILSDDDVARFSRYCAATGRGNTAFHLAHGKEQDVGQQAGCKDS
jgi:hypothetical protein